MNNLYRIHPQPAFNFAGLVIDIFAGGFAPTSKEMSLVSRQQPEPHSLRRTRVDGRDQFLRGNHYLIAFTFEGLNSPPVRRLPEKDVNKVQRPPRRVAYEKEGSNIIGIPKLHQVKRIKHVRCAADDCMCLPPLSSLRQDGDRTLQPPNVSLNSLHQADYDLKLNSVALTAFLIGTAISAARYPYRDKDRRHRTYRLNPCRRSLLWPNHGEDNSYSSQQKPVRDRYPWFEKFVEAFATTHRKFHLYRLACTGGFYSAGAWS